MADPRAYTGAPKKSISTSSQLNAMTNFCRAMNPNNPAATRVGAGLQSLVSISTALGRGGKLPVSVDNVSSNTKWVLDIVGINTQTLYKAGQGKSSIVEAGYAAANGVFDKVKSGNFRIQDIPLFQPPLENLYNIQKFNTNFDPSPLQGEVQVSPYAMDLSAMRLKQKFTFVVQFTFNAPYMQDANFQRRAAFVIKKSTRPGMKYITDPVNYYNFRTTVVTRAELQEMALTMYDDGFNSVQALYTAYTRAMSPIVNYSAANQTMELEQQGMINNTNNDSTQIPGIQGSQPYSKLNSGSTGPLADSNKFVVNNIKLYQVYDNGLKANIFHFFNPVITNIDLDDLDMSSSEINTIDLKFNYESMYHELAQDVSSINFAELTNQGRYPLRHQGAAVHREQISYGQNNIARNRKAGCASDAVSFFGNAVGSASNFVKSVF